MEAKRRIGMPPPTSCQPLHNDAGETSPCLRPQIPAQSVWAADKFGFTAAVRFLLPPPPRLPQQLLEPRSQLCGRAANGNHQLRTAWLSSGTEQRVRKKDRTWAIPSYLPLCQVWMQTDEVTLFLQSCFSICFICFHSLQAISGASITFHQPPSFLCSAQG